MASRIGLYSVLKVSMLCVALLTGCSDDDDTIGVSGVVRSVVNDAVQANRDFVVKDADNALADVASGKSDSNGNFSFSLGKGTLHIVIIFPPVTASAEPRSSGLLFVGDDTAKTLDAVTDLACQAGVTALTAGDLTADDLDSTRIANLEAGAEDVLAQHEADGDPVDFSDPDSVAAAAQEVRDLTNDGDNPPA